MDDIGDWRHQFDPDDFDRIYTKYFKKLIETGSVRFDPSGWLNTISNASSEYQLSNISKKDLLVPYYSDYHDQLKPQKSNILALLSKWDAYEYEFDELTLCSSVTLGSYIVMSTLAKKGIKTIFFETPAFYASINQAKSLGLTCIQIPTYLERNFALTIPTQTLEKYQPYAICLTQPRMSLGMNQKIEFVDQLYSKLPEDSYILIDEASEQLFPSHLHSFNVRKYPRVIKIRNIFKGLGINGIRLSYIAHQSSLRQDIQRELENIQGAIDIYSLDASYQLSKEQHRFQTMLEIANKQTIELRKSIERLFSGREISVSPLVNGYVGTISVSFEHFPYGHKKNRELRLKHCFNDGIPLILGATMKFAKHPNREFIRLNYFKHRQVLEKSVESILKFVQQY